MPAIRSGLMNVFTNRFISQNADCMVLNLGCGLDSRYLRIPCYGQWVDIDFPQIMKLRETLFPERKNHDSISCPITDLSWLELIPERSRKTLVIAEGTLMYLDRGQVAGLFESITAKLDDVVFLFDVFSCRAAARANRPGGRQQPRAAVCWGADTPDEITAMCRRMHYVHAYPLAAPEYIRKLEWPERFAFSLAARVPTLRDAHRVFVFKASQRAEQESARGNFS